MVRKLLAPNGKMYTERQLDRLNMKQVFDFLMDLGVADKSQYREFRRFTRRPSRPTYVVTYVRRPRRVRVKTRTRPVLRKPALPSPRYGCPSHQSALQCRLAGCYWTGTSCLTP